MKTIIHKLAGAPGDENDFFIMRDDLLPFSMGGNKVRIAEAFYRDMKESGCDCMIIYGSRHSNLCRVLSALCRSRQVPCYMICSHEEGEGSEVTNNTRLIGWTGTEMIHCAKTEIAGTVESLVNRLKGDGFFPYYIYGTKFGTGNEGTAAGAYAGVYPEILAYQREQGIAFDYMFCASGTGATQSGLICGHLLADDGCRIVGVMISSRETDRARRVIADGIRAYFARYLPSFDCGDDLEKEIHLLDDCRKGGYGKYDGEIEDCIREEYCRNGVPLDPIYTGKAFWGMKRYLRENAVKGKKVLFLHTGGAPLFYDWLNKGVLAC